MKIVNVNNNNPILGTDFYVLEKTAAVIYIYNSPTYERLRVS